MEIATRRRGLTQKQVMSLLGVVPLGVYVVAHLWTNLYALGGAEPFDAALKSSRAHPAFLLLEIFGLGVPILIHAGIGLQLMRKARPNNARYGTLRNLKFSLQRLSALGVLLFIAAHVAKARVQPAMAGTTETWQGMHAALSEPATLAVYVLGLLGVSFHLANGLWGTALTLGVTVSPAAQRWMERVSIAVFLGLLTMSALAIVGFRPFQ
jgi:succinate dehydrogenase / fumarate reductase cytochrome b subunit